MYYFCGEKNYKRKNWKFWKAVLSVWELSLQRQQEIWMSADHSAFSCSYSCLIGEGTGSPLQYSCLENPMGRGTWWATVHRVAKSRTRLSNFTSHHSCLIESPSREPVSLAMCSWHWPKYVGLSVSRVQEKQILHRDGINHHLRMVLIPPSRGSRNTFCYPEVLSYFLLFI